MGGDPRAGSSPASASFNFTGQFEDQNAENLLVIRDKGMADKYSANWKAHAAHSEKYAKATGQR